MANGHDDLEERLRRLEEQTELKPKFGILPGWHGYGSLEQYQAEVQQGAREDAERQAEIERHNRWLREQTAENRRRFGIEP